MVEVRSRVDLRAPGPIDLARTPFAIPAEHGAAAPAIGAGEAVDRVAAWLLGQSGLQGSK